jgi:FKBP-type peptidyl-prolyl cis-trans isomerase FkpA
MPGINIKIAVDYTGIAVESVLLCMRKTACLLLLIVPFFMGCQKSQAVIDNEIIQNYISANHLNATVEANGLYFVPVSGGNGVYASAASVVSVTYKGFLPNGAVFDQKTTPTTFNLSQVISGWTEGIPLMQKGQTAMLLIPSALGYGSTAQPAGNGTAAIPANSVLIFNVTLISFQ